MGCSSKDQGGGKRRGEGIVNERAEARLGRTNGGVTRAACLATYLLRSEAQWDKTRRKSRCQCHASGDGEGQGQNYSYIHGNHTLFSDVNAKQTIAIAVKYPMRSAAIVISGITLLPA